MYPIKIKPKFYLSLLLIFYYSLSFSQKKINLSSIPNWVKEIKHTSSSSNEQIGGYRYLLADNQINLEAESEYYHYVIKILNPDGIQNMSDLEFNYDPSYQNLKIHTISIIRNGKKIDKTKDSNIQEIQKENNSDRSLYDGTLSTIVNLKDVRENDVLEYAYTIQGFNPINKGHFSSSIYQKFTFPVEKMVTIVYAPRNTPLNLKYFKAAKKPQITTTSTQKVYSWESNDSDYIIYDNNVPIWYDAQPRVNISTFKNWKEVVDWALPLYEQKTTIQHPINISKKTDQSETITKIIRFVQNEIRYLGFESGINAYKPHQPNKVLNQRYGDCKDKSLLLIALLKNENIKAYPLLVNTNYKKELINYLPSNSIFNHCVVQFEFRNKKYYVDPTISNQGGDIDHLHFPNYKYGLLIKPNEEKLINIPDSKPGTLSINEFIQVDSIGGDAKIKITSTYYGAKADDIRGYFKSNTTKSIEKEYLNYYSNLYSQIEKVDNIIIKDDFYNTTNKIETIEHYLIKNFWKPIDSTTPKNIFSEIYPIVLESYIDYDKSANRTMPFYLGNPTNFNQTTTINLPEDWFVSPDSTNISNFAQEYKNKISGFKNIVTINHSYKLKKEFITNKEVNEFIESIDKIQNNLSYNLNYNGDVEGFKLSWFSVLLAIVSTIGISFFFYYNYHNFNPIPKNNTVIPKIGGWLVLPMIGLLINPFKLSIEVFSLDFFNHSIWTNIFQSYSLNEFYIAFFISLEIIYNFCLLIFSIYILILFFSKRTSLPYLVSLLYLLNIAIPVIDGIITYALIDENTEIINPAEFIKTIIIAIIWIPYFLYSERAKNTFVNTKNILE